MARYSAQTYTAMFDQLLTQELMYSSFAASEANIKTAMKRILGRSIQDGLLKRYSSLVLDEGLNVHFTIVDADGDEIPLTLFYGQ